MSNTQRLHSTQDARIVALQNLGFEIRIRRTDSGDKILAVLFNITQLLRHYPLFQNRARYDQFAQVVMWENEQGIKERISDYHIDTIRLECEDRWGVAFSADKVWSAVELVAKENAYNPILKHFESLRGKWKGKKKRAERFLIDYLGAADTEINRAYSLRFLLSVVARAYATIDKPVKVDTTLVLYGGQGIGKSTALEALCFSDTFGSIYFGDSELSMDKYKEAVQSIQGKLIYEIQELARRSKSVEVEKAFLTRKIDDVRLPYKRANEKFARRTVFVATTNKKNVLHDATGSRRFWCVDLGKKKIDITKLKKDLSLIWSEVLYYYDKKEQHYLTDKEEKLREQSAQDFTDPHPLTGAVLEIAERLHPPITTARIIEELYSNPDPTKDSMKHLDKSTRQNQNIINDILQSNGYEYGRKKAKMSDRRVRGWWPL
jgi:predicted P-loop ATPase